MATQDKTAHQVGRQQPLYEAARECDRLFKHCLTSQPQGQEGIAQNHRRFGLWVAYLGVFAPQKASLDTRLIDSPEIRELILLLLSVLQRNLSRAIQRRHSIPQKFETNLSDDVERKTIEEPSGSINAPQGPVYGISGAVDRLHRLAVRIRISSTDNQSLEKKIAQFAQKFKSDEFNSLVFLVLKYKFPHAEEKLLDQLARSIIYRRQRLLYGRYHQKKLSYDRDSKAPPIDISQSDKLQQQEQHQEIGLVTKTEIRKETEDTFESAERENVSETNPTLFKLEEFQRHQSPPKSTAATLISTGSSSWAGKVTYPRPPKAHEGSSHASCPFCFQEHSLDDFEDPHWWKKHVDGDLQHFVCISEDCSDSPYYTTSSNTWLNHMTLNHSMDWSQYIHAKREWRCPFTFEGEICNMPPFSDSSLLEKHLSDSHSTVLRDYDLTTLAQKCSAAIPRDPNICPLCVSTINHQLDQTQDSAANDQSNHPLESKSKKSVRFATAVATSISETNESSKEDGLRKRMARHIARHLKILSFISIRGLELDEDNDSAISERSETMENILEVDTKENESSISIEPLLYCGRDSCDCMDRKKNSTVDWGSLEASFKTAIIIPEIKLPTSHDDPSYSLTEDAQSEWAFWYPLSINRKKIGPSEYGGHANDEKLMGYFQIDTKETTELSNTSRAETSLDNVDIRQLWNIAWRKLREEDSALIEEYEAKLQGSVVAGLKGILKSNSNIGELLPPILPNKMGEANTNAAKPALSSSEVETKEVAELVLAVVGSTNSYIAQAVSANPYASIAWAGVIFLLSVSTIASAQSASLARGLKYISHLISQSYMREGFYIESYNPAIQSQEELQQPHHAYKDNLERLYRQILRFQAQSYCYYSDDSNIHHGLDASKSSHWEQLLSKVRALNAGFIEVERTWKQIQSDFHQPSNTPGPVAAEVEKEAYLRSLSFKHMDARKDDILQVNHSTLNFGLNGTNIDEATRLQKEKEACLRSLRFKYMDARKDDISLAHPRTCDWFFETRQFQHWYHRDNLQNHNGVLWIKGHPGTGKSTLMKHTLRHLEEELSETHIIAAHFFNARGDYSERTSFSMLRSLLYQLLEKEPVIYKRFLPLFRDKVRRLDTGWEWQESYLKNFLLSEIQHCRPKPLTVLVDALDECEEEHARDVVKFLEDLSIKAIAVEVTLNICLSSRHFPYLSMQRHLELVVEETSEHNEDIVIYTRDNLAIRYGKIEEELLEKASGVFMWAVFVIKLLNKAYDEGQIEAMHKTLHEVPGGLEHMFEALLIKDNPDKHETVFMLQFVLLAKRPVKPEELYFATLAKTTDQIKAWDQSQITPDIIQRRITNSSRGLIKIRKGEENVVQFIHKSVNVFLIRNQKLQKLDPDLKMNALGSSHECLRSCCMNYIMMSQSATGRKQIRALRFRYPFLEYASLYILDHAEEADEHQIGQDAFLQRLLDEPKTLEKMRLFHNFFEQNSGSGCSRGASLLYMLAFHGHYRLTKALLKKNIDINAQGGFWGNALQAAVGEDNMEMVKLLLEEGADVDAQCGPYGNALQIAAAIGKKEHVELLLEKGAYVNAQGGYFGNALQAAAAIGKNEVVKMLLKEGADIHAQSGFAGNALCAAAAAGQREILEMLLKEGANVNAQGGPYGNALCAAAIENKADAVRLLLENGADVDSKTEIYGNALQAATIQRNETIMELLVKAGADTNPPESYFNPGDQAAITLETQGQLLETLLKKRVHVSPSTQKALLIFFGNALREDVWEETKEILLKENIEAHNQWIYDFFCYSAMNRLSDDDAAVRLSEKGANPKSYRKGFPIGLPLAMLWGD